MELTPNWTSESEVSSLGRWVLVRKIELIAGSCLESDEEEEDDDDEDDEENEEVEEEAIAPTTAAAIACSIADWGPVEDLAALT